ncbi:MAG: hypothetical protein SOV95_07275 [Anaerovibrio sp.]|uniref:hypothetical protein n=1 Tax=Anaerovibrio sp. TaxID=1872532 RepID=UPI00261F13AC|nr:hypothetical protein [Anaerovibrio sp.]MDD7678201.1 hypothetical protein [Anaerovibrio sp.]MDY2604057.1 hypothetical protein [Anaerovibrio sp.]MDY4884156.1 hypothetical protein [Anaerovibrio sp.]
MSDEERVLDKEHEWDFIVAGWPREVQEIDGELLALEQSLEDMLEVAIQQTVSRCKRYAQDAGYPFTTFQLNRSLIFFNRAVEELSIRDVPQEERTEFRDNLTERFLAFLDEVIEHMRTEEQIDRMKSGIDNDRFPGDIIGMALINQSLRLLAKVLAPMVEMKRHDYMSKNRGVLIELLNKHASQLNLGKEIC